jgi:hypothetical protein
MHFIESVRAPERFRPYPNSIPGTREQLFRVFDARVIESSSTSTKRARNLGATTHRSSSFVTSEVPPAAEVRYPFTGWPLSSIVAKLCFGIAA